MVHAKVGWVLTRVNSANGTPRFITHAPTQARGARLIAHANDTRTRARTHTHTREYKSYEYVDTRDSNLLSRYFTRTHECGVYRRTRVRRGIRRVKRERFPLSE